jgi:hypothetical protein
VTATNHNTVDGCLPALVQAYTTLQQMAAAPPLGIAFGVADYGGLRDEATVEQLQLWEQQAVARGEKPYRVAPYGYTKHEYGGAFDVRIIIGGSGDPFAELGKLAPRCGLIWGGTWLVEPDVRHFELEAPLDVLRTEWLQLHPANA